MMSEAQTAFGPLGEMFASDIDADVAGINAFIGSLSGPNKSRSSRATTSSSWGEDPAALRA